MALSRACAGCGTELSAGAKFCLECGRSTATAPGVAAERAPRDYTPKHLADKILQSKSALVGERKQVTVLFADVKGSLELPGNSMRIHSELPVLSPRKPRRGEIL